MKARHGVHHAVVEISSLVMKIHGLEEVVVRFESKHIELCVSAGVFINDEVASLRVHSFLMRVIFLLINLKENK